MARTDGLRILLRQVDHRAVGPGPAHQAFPRRFAEGQAELDAGDGTHQGFVDVLDRLDEVRLAEDEVGVFRLIDLDGSE
ncbi:hypothetical protein D3C78_1435060 [compost metagenome]